MAVVAQNSKGDFSIWISSLYWKTSEPPIKSKYLLRKSMQILANFPTILIKWLTVPFELPVFSFPLSESICRGSQNELYRLSSISYLGNQSQRIRYGEHFGYLCM